jgi:hypothetical protein
MAINAFEGARRIAKLVAALWVVGWIVAAFNQPAPYISVHYQISWPKPPHRSDLSCEYGNNAIEYVEVITKNGTAASATLCFLAERAEDGRKLIPYGPHPKDSSLWIANTKYSDDVKKYIEKVKDSFLLSQADEAWIDGQLWPKRLKEFSLGALIAIGGLVFLWVFTWTVGWIMRGFLGIPRGQDHRPSAPER